MFLLPALGAAADVIIEDVEVAVMGARGGLHNDWLHLPHLILLMVERYAVVG